MADITAIRRGIAANLETVFGAAGPQADLGFTVTATVETPPNAPALVVLKGPTSYGEAMQDAVSKLTFLVRAYLPMPASAEQQDMLDELLSFPHARSVKAAIELVDKTETNTVTLGGACSDMSVNEDTGHRIWQLAGIEYLGAEWSMEVWA